MAVSAMKRNGEVSSSCFAPSASVGAFQSWSSATFARRFARACSMNLVIMMYQLPIDMITSSSSTKRATKSPFFHSAPRPYGLLTVSDVAGGGGGWSAAGTGAGAVAAVAGALAVAPAEAVALVSLACALASVGATKVSTVATANNMLAASAAKERFFMPAPVQSLNL
ncbi:hypothetical protein PT2222_80220 [Paraburkholderia tropica]